MIQRNEQVQRFERLTQGAQQQAISVITIPREMALNVLAYIVRLENKLELASTIAAFRVGDVVREVGEEEPTGTIIEIKPGIDENGYIVELFNPTQHYASICYYTDEIELIRRPDL